MKKHVFLSYCRENLEVVRQLRDDLVAGGEAVWWDQELLPGQDWQQEIRQAMQDSYAVVLCLSREAEERVTSGIFPEVRNAIELYRLYPPRSIFLIPVRLSACAVPAFPIDGTRTLQDLHYVDLFPAAVRAMHLQRVLQALRRTPGHPGVPEAGPQRGARPERPGNVARPPWAADSGTDTYGVYADLRVQSVVQRMRRIEAGEFWMGSPTSEAQRNNDETRHRVRISQAFWLADTTCTQALWQAVMGSNPSCFKGQERPVEQVSWDDVQEFLQRLRNVIPEGSWRLPTEAEWEYACRAGTTTPFWFGEQITPEQVNYDGNYPYAGGKTGQYREETVPVKALPCNGWGLYQMHGNVWEWCQDWYGDYAAATAANSAETTAVDPTGSAAGADRVLRGGSWGSGGGSARSAQRGAYRPGHRYASPGFRLALSQAR